MPRYVPFVDKLRRAQEKNDSWLCVGLDPDPDRIPKPYTIEAFCNHIIRATQSLVCAYKPNLAFFLAHGTDGLTALEQILKDIPADIPVILDAKVGDIGTTQRMYGDMAFRSLKVDAMTVSPYVGKDAVAPILEAFPNKGLYVLGRTSNAGSEKIQKTTEPPLYEEIARLVSQWNQELPGTVGMVAGATYPEELKQLRAMAPHVPFLIPGIGAQGGALDMAVSYGRTLDGIGPVITSSRSILYASEEGRLYRKAAQQAAQRLYNKINQWREGME